MPLVEEGTDARADSVDTPMRAIAIGKRESRDPIAIGYCGDDGFQELRCYVSS